MHQVKIEYEFIRKINNSNKGIAIFFNSKDMILIKINYIINSIMQDELNTNNVLFINKKITSWEDNIETLKNFILEKEKGEILLLYSTFTFDFKTIEKFIAKLLIK
jgi:hypothetical protein